MARHLILIATATTGLALVSACQKKPVGQVVAVVNGEEITQQDLNTELQGATLPPSADKKAVMSQVLQRVIDRTLLVQKAKAEGIDKSPTYVAQVRRGEDALAVNLLTAKAAKNIKIPTASAIDQFIASNPTLFGGRKVLKLDQIAFAQPSDASMLQRLQPAHSLDAIAAVLTSEGIQFTRGTSQLDTGALPPPIAAKINSLPPGEPFVAPEKGQIVVSVITSSVADATPQVQERPAAINFLRQQALGSAMQKQLETVRSTAKIDYQTNFAPAKTK